MLKIKKGDTVKIIAGKEKGEEAGDEQFEISDGRSLNRMYEDIESEGLQPVYNDYVYL